MDSRWTHTGCSRKLLCTANESKSTGGGRGRKKNKSNETRLRTFSMQTRFIIREPIGSLSTSYKKKKKKNKNNASRSRNKRDVASKGRFVQGNRGRRTG